MSRGRASSGFTLVELLVALFAMALLAVMSWRGLDGMSRAQAQTEARSDEMLTLQVGLAQWTADLDALLELPQTVHPYFLAGQFHPELTSRPLRPQPMFMGLIKAAVEFAEAKEKKQPQAV